MKYDITLCMIVKDEEERLEGCLASAAGYADEIIIVDTGSTDDSVRIARRFGARVIHAPWQNDFARARNAGLELATMQWVLCLDADERLEPPPPDYFSSLLSQGDVHGYYVRIKSFIGGFADGEHMTDEACRLFRNDPRIRFSRPIHEQVVGSVLALPGARLLRSKLTVLHEGYLDRVIAGKNKSARNMAILETALSREPEDPEYRYAYGTELFQLQKYEEALRFFLPLLYATGHRSGLPAGSAQLLDMTLKTAYALNRAGRTDEAVALLRQGLERYPDHPEILELLVGLYLEKRSPWDALPLLELANPPGNGGTRHALSGSGSYRSKHLAGLACEGLRMFEEAVACYSGALSAHPGYAPSWSRLPLLALLTEQEEPLAKLLSELSCRIPADRWIAILHETIYTGKNGFAAMIWEQLIPNDIRNSYYPLWEGIVTARENAETAESIFERLDDSAERDWYLWAVRAKASPEHSADCPLVPGTSEPITEPLYRRCQNVLLQVGAWDALLGYMDRCGQDAAYPLLPVHRYYAYLNAPAAAVRALLLTAERWRRSLAVSDGLALGALAVQIGMPREAQEWFRFAAELDPSRPEPSAALAYAHRLTACRLLPARWSRMIAETEEETRRRMLPSLLIPG